MLDCMGFFPNTRGNKTHRRYIVYGGCRWGGKTYALERMGFTIKAQRASRKIHPELLALKKPLCIIRKPDYAKDGLGLQAAYRILDETPSVHELIAKHADFQLRYHTIPSERKAIYLEGRFEVQSSEDSANETMD